MSKILILLKNLVAYLQECSLKQRLLIALPVVLVLLMVLGFWLRNHGGSTSFRTVPVGRGDLVATISATGTVEPEEVRDVGTQVAGRIVAVGRDKHGKPVDYGSFVEAGTILAQIDDALYAPGGSPAKGQRA